MKVACTLHVTAGVIVSSGRMPPAAASRERRGVSGPRWRGVSPTVRRTRVGRIAVPGASRASSRQPERPSMRTRLASCAGRSD